MFFGTNCVIVRAFTEQNKAASDEMPLTWHHNGGLRGHMALPPFYFENFYLEILENSKTRSSSVWTVHLQL